MVASIFPAYFFFNQEEEERRIKKPVYFWGSNTYGLANPACESGAAPLLVRQPHKCYFWGEKKLYLIDICAGERHAAALDNEGNLWQWGEDAGVTKVGPVKRITGKHFKSIECNDQIILGLTEGGNLYAVPVNAKDGEIKQLECVKMSRIACGHDHVLGCSTSGKLYTAALNTSGNAYGQLGIGLVEEEYVEGEKKDSPIPKTIIDWPREEPVAEEKETEMEAERQIHDPISFQEVEIPGKVIDVAAGYHHSLVLTDQKVVFVFGANSNLQLGLGNTADLAYPKPKALHNPKQVTKIAAAGNTSFFLSKTNQLYSAGNGLYGQLGIGGFHHAVGEPTILPTVSNQYYFDEMAKNKKPLSIKEIWTSPNNAAVLMETYHPTSIDKEKKSDNQGFDILAWGSNKHFQLGCSSHSNIPTPQTMRPPSPTNALVDYDDLALSKEGPTSVNPEGTLSFTGGQLQVLPDDQGKPQHKMFLGPEFGCLY